MEASSFLLVGYKTGKNNHIYIILYLYICIIEVKQLLGKRPRVQKSTTGTHYFFFIFVSFPSIDLVFNHVNLKLTIFLCSRQCCYSNV